MQRRGSAAQRDTVLDAAEIGELALEGFDFRTLHERCALANAIECRENFVAQLRVFGLQIQKRNFHHGHVHPWKNSTHTAAVPQVFRDVSGIRVPRMRSIDRKASIQDGGAQRKLEVNLRFWERYSLRGGVRRVFGTDY